MKQVASLHDTVSLAHDASNLAPFLLMLQRSYPESYRDILSAVRLVAPFFDDFVLEPNQENKELVGLRWRQKGYETVFGANQLSDGTLRFICLATVLLQPSELQPSAIILDEPELGLHPSAVQILAELVHSISRRKQIIISTQSAALLSCFDADDVIVAETSDEGSVYRRLSPEKLEGWLEDYTLGEIWEKNIIGGRP